MYKREYFDTENDAKTFAKNLNPLQWSIIEISKWFNEKYAVEYETESARHVLSQQFLSDTPHYQNLVKKSKIRQSDKPIIKGSIEGDDDRLLLMIPLAAYEIHRYYDGSWPYMFMFFSAKTGDFLYTTIDDR